MSPKSSLGSFKLVEETSQFNKVFRKNCNEGSDIGYFSEVDVQCSENLHELHSDFRFLPERMTTEKVEELAANLHDKEKTCYTNKQLKISIKSWISNQKIA